MEIGFKILLALFVDGLYYHSHARLETFRSLALFTHCMYMFPVQSTNI